MPLFVRGPRGLRPTAAGTVFAERARQMVEEFDALRRVARTASASPIGLLRVGVPIGMPSVVVAHMSDTIHALWPNVRLDLVCATSNEDLLGRVDCRFSFEIELGDETIEVVELGTMREQLVASGAYLESQPPIRSVADLAEHPLFAWIAPDTGVPVSLHVLSAPEPRVAISTATNDLASLVWLAGNHRGLVFMPFEPAVALIVGQSDLVPVLPDVVGRDRPRRLITPKALADVPVVAAFVDRTRAIAEQLFGK